MEDMRLRKMEQLLLLTKKLLRYTYDKVNNVVL